VQEDVLGAVLGLNEAEALGRVEPLNGADSHEIVPIETGKPPSIIAWRIIFNLKRKQAQNPSEWAGEANRNNETDRSFIENRSSFRKFYFLL
jgi:hypothetical protein